jgi:hypothetical protein
MDNDSIVAVKTPMKRHKIKIEAIKIYQWNRYNKYNKYINNKIVSLLFIKGP